MSPLPNNKMFYFDNSQPASHRDPHRIFMVQVSIVRAIWGAQHLFCSSLIDTGGRVEVSLDT